MNGGGSRSLNLALDQNTSSDLKTTFAKRCFFSMASNFNRRGIFRRLTEVSTESMNEGFCRNQSQQLFMVFHKNLTAVLSSSWTENQERGQAHWAMRLSVLRLSSVEHLAVGIILTNRY